MAETSTPCAVEPCCTRTPSRVWQGQRMCGHHYNVVRCGWVRCTNDCGRWAELRGFCTTCYARRTRRGLEPKRPITQCPIEGCERTIGQGSRVAGYCAYHGYRLGVYGDPLRERAPRQETCRVEGCERPRRGTDPYCGTHRHRLTRHGHLAGMWPRDLSLIEALVSRLNFEGAVHPEFGQCWEWTGNTNTVDGPGYGIFRWNKTFRLAHRTAWELMVGPIPDGLVVDHLCRNTLCVRPEHLEPVTQAENLRRGWLAMPPDDDEDASSTHPYGVRTLMVCSVDGCNRAEASAGSGLCGPHTRRLRKWGDVNGGTPVPPIDMAEQMARFWDKVDKRPNGCWLWTGALTTGYGQFGIGGRNCRAHRIAYEQAVGPIRVGLVLDHLCMEKRCVNPAHLEPVTTRENLRRARVAAQ